MPDPQDPAQTPAQNDPVAPASDPVAPPAPEPQAPAAPANPQGDEGQPAQPAAPAAPADPASGAPTPDGGQQPSRAERRIKQLNAQMRQAQPSYQQPGQQPQSPQFPSYKEGDVVSPERLQQDVVQTADAIATIRVNQQLAQRDAINNFDRDTETVPTTYDELNPDKPNYTPELDEAIAQEFQERAFKPIYNQQGQLVGKQLDPSVRLADIAKRQITAARAYAVKAGADMHTRVNAVADSTAPQPGGGKPAEKQFADLSLDEMRAKVGYHKV